MSAPPLGGPAALGTLTAQITLLSSSAVFISRVLLDFMIPSVEDSQLHKVLGLGFFFLRNLFIAMLNCVLKSALETLEFLGSNVCNLCYKQSHESRGQ